MAKAEENMVYVKELAKLHKALVLVVENRFFGNSLPFGEEASKHIEYLTIEQSMKDTVNLVRTIKEKYYIEGYPTIAFGGK